MFSAFFSKSHLICPLIFAVVSIKSFIKWSVGYNFQFLIKFLRQLTKMTNPRMILLPYPHSASSKSKYESKYSLLLDISHRYKSILVLNHDKSVKSFIF